MVVGPQQEQVLGGVAVIPGDLGDGHLVQRHRDGAHAVLGQHQAEQPLELVDGEPLLHQDRSGFDGDQAVAFFILVI